MDFIPDDLVTQTDADDNRTVVHVGQEPDYNADFDEDEYIAQNSSFLTTGISPLIILRCCDASGRPIKEFILPKVLLEFRSAYFRHQLQHASEKNGFTYIDLLGENPLVAHALSEYIAFKTYTSVRFKSNPLEAAAFHLDVAWKSESQYHVVGLRTLAQEKLRGVLVQLEDEVIKADIRCAKDTLGKLWVQMGQNVEKLKLVANEWDILSHAMQAALITRVWQASPNSSGSGRRWRIAEDDIDAIQRLIRQAFRSDVYQYLEEWEPQQTAMAVEDGDRLLAAETELAKAAVSCVWNVYRSDQEKPIKMCSVKDRELVLYNTSKKVVKQFTLGVPITALNVVFPGQGIRELAQTLRQYRRRGAITRETQQDAITHQAWLATLLRSGARCDTVVDPDAHERECLLEAIAKWRSAVADAEKILLRMGRGSAAVTSSSVKAAAAADTSRIGVSDPFSNNYEGTDSWTAGIVLRDFAYQKEIPSTSELLGKVSDPED